MTQVIQKIVTILNGYGYGKFLALRKKNKTAPGAEDVVTISDEARKRSRAAGSEEAVPPVEEI